MDSWTVLDTAIIPNNGGELTLSQCDDEFSISISGVSGELMNSCYFGSEEALSELGCEHIKSEENAHVLVGGLGMGYTLAAALREVNDTATVTVAELIPEVVEWNKGPLGECAGNPLSDPRAKVRVGDVAELFDDEKPAFDSILLDVDNGPKGITHKDNQWLYSLSGLKAIYNTLHPEGMLAIWSAGTDPLFLIRLKKTGFRVTMRTVKEHNGGGRDHTIYLAKKSTQVYF